MGGTLKFLRSGRGLSTFAGLALGWMVLVILWGAVVRATGSGAGCGAHWPLCNGDFFPSHPRLATLIEFTHRSMSGICTALVAALIGWTFLAHPRGDRVRRAAVWSGALLFTEALLGALLVLGGYVEHNTSNMRVAMQCVHFTNTMLLLGALTLAWWWQRPHRLPASRGNPPKGIAAAALGFMVLTGATGSVAALADTLFPATSLRSALLADLSPASPLLVRMRFLHPAASLGAFLLIGALAFRLSQGRRNLLLSFLASQLLLGIVDVLALAPVWLQIAHLLGADLLWIALVSSAADVLSPAPQAARYASSPLDIARPEMTEALQTESA